MPTLATNKEAHFRYHITQEYDAGIALTGAEVKSIKLGRCSLRGSFVTVSGSELWLTNAHVSPYAHAAGRAQPDPTRPRKLLMKRKEIDSLIGTLKAKGLTVLPLSVYTKGSLIKVRLGVCRGKKLYDKRATIKKRETNRSIQRLLRNKQ